MIVARKPPKSIKSVVYKTDTEYEIVYCRPASLGTIDKRGDYWYTKDGMRFRSGRAAMEYLVRMYDVAVPVPPMPDLPEHKRKDVADKSERKTKPVKRKGATAGPTQLTKDWFVNEIIDYLRAHPEVRKIVGKEKDATDLRS